MEGEAYLYPHSRADAIRRNELSLWRDSLRENIRCKEAVEAAIRRDFDGVRLREHCAESVIADFGYKRTAFVLANTLQELSHDGRFSWANKEWSQRTFVPPDKESNIQFAVCSHPAVLDGLVNQYRRAVQELGMFDRSQCDEEPGTLDYTDRVLALLPAVLKESCWRAEDQLWYAHDGFGCAPNARGRSIRCTCLGDGEMTRWNRADFLGPVREDCLPDWARERVEQLRAGQSIVAPTAPEMTLE